MNTEMKVGELARRSGLTVRTLHHYDEIGLLRPTNRTGSGHRLYGFEDVGRLQAIASLRQLGLSLAEIRQWLDRPGHPPLRDILTAQIDRVEEQLASHRRLLARLVDLRDRLTANETVSMDDLTRTIKETWHMDKYYSAEQLEYLAARKEQVGEARIREVQAEWAELFRAYGEAMKADLDPSSAEVRALARKSAALIEEFTGGDPGIYASLSNMYGEQGPNAVLDRHDMAPAEGVWEYMGRAAAALKAHDPS